MTEVTDEMVETAWAAIVGDDIAKTCFNASIIRADLKTGLTAALAANNQEAWVAALLNSPNPEQTATPAVGGEPVGYLIPKSGIDNGNYFIEPHQYVHVEERFQHLYTPVYAIQPASPLRGREDLAPSPCSDLSIGELIEWLDNPQWTNGYLNSDAANHMSAAAELIERLVSSAPPEQPAAAPAGREEIARAFLYETGMFDNEAEIKANPEHRLVKAAYAAADRLLTAPDKQPLRYGEPVWPGNENDDLDKGSDA